MATTLEEFIAELFQNREDPNFFSDDTPSSTLGVNLSRNLNDILIDSPTTLGSGGENIERRGSPLAAFGSMEAAVVAAKNKAFFDSILGKAVKAALPAGDLILGPMVNAAQQNTALATLANFQNRRAPLNEIIAQLQQSSQASGGEGTGASRGAVSSLGGSRVSAGPANRGRTGGDSGSTGGGGGGSRGRGGGPGGRF